MARLARLRVTGDGALDHVQPGRRSTQRRRYRPARSPVGSDADSPGFRWSRRTQRDGGQILDATGPRDKAKRRTSRSLRGRDATENRRQDRGLLFVVEVHREQRPSPRDSPARTAADRKNGKWCGHRRRREQSRGRGASFGVPPKLEVGASASCRDARRSSRTGFNGQAAPCNRLHAKSDDAPIDDAGRAHHTHIFQQPTRRRRSARAGAHLPE